jgi:GntR family transcriptional regulator
VSTPLRQPDSLESSLRKLIKISVRTGNPLPPEKVLADQLGVSRGAVRESLIRMESAGLVARRQGAGTYVNPVAVDVPVRIDGTFEFADMLKAAGFKATIEVLESAWIELPDEIAEELHCEPGGPALRTVKVWMADGKPVMTAEDIIPAGEVCEVDPADSIFILAEETAGVSTEWVATWLNPVLATKTQAKILKIGMGEPILELKQIGVTREGNRCWWAREFHNANALGYGLVRVVPVTRT